MDEPAIRPEPLGPVDGRPIAPADVAEIAHEAVRLLHSARAVHGHRRAVTGALAAILSGVQALAVLCGDAFVADVLRDHLATADRRTGEAERGAAAPTIQ